MEGDTVRITGTLANPEAWISADDAGDIKAKSMAKIDVTTISVGGQLIRPQRTQRQRRMKQVDQPYDTSFKLLRF